MRLDDRRNSIEIKSIPECSLIRLHLHEHSNLSFTNRNFINQNFRTIKLKQIKYLFNFIKIFGEYFTAKKYVNYVIFVPTISLQALCTHPLSNIYSIFDILIQF